MTPVFIDFETYWDRQHSLTKMSAIEYCLSPKTEIICLALKIGKGQTQVEFGEAAVQRMIDAVDWSDKFVIAHNNAAFDAMLLAWRFGVKPAMWGCTLSMARPVHAKDVGLGLGKLVAHYGLGVKNNAVLLQTVGRNLKDFTPQERADMRIYNQEDTDQCAQLFRKLLPHFTAKELWHIDCNIRMLVEPVFDLDVPMLRVAQSMVRSEKHKAQLDLAQMLRGPDSPDLDWSDELAVAEWVRSQLASQQKFAALLESRGAEVPMKRSKTDMKKMIPALAKNDEGMQELLFSDDPLIEAAASCRLGVKSTQLETRIDSFVNTFEQVGKLPVPAHYCGADTTGRDSGWLYNMYNLPRVVPGKPRAQDALRNSVRAPKGQVIFVNDSSGIELRVNHTLWQAEASTALWKAKADADLYRATAAQYYGVEESAVEKGQRQFAKALELACGFGTGGPTFRQTARIQGGLKLTLDEAKSGVKAWRARYPEISDFNNGGWGRCEEALNYIMEGAKVPIDPLGMCTTEQDAIVLPSGRRIRYPGLRRVLRERHKEVDGELVTRMEPTWVYGPTGKREAYLYGAKVDENIVQALARDILFDQAFDYFKSTGLRPNHKVYDELVYIATPTDAPALLKELQRVMKTPPTWWSSLILWCEGDIAETYGDAK